MIYCDQRSVQTEAEGLRIIDTNQKRADQSRTLSYCHTFNLIIINPCFA